MKLMNRLLVTAAFLLALPAAQAQSDWTPCAEENAMCRVSGEAMVRFGVEGRYAFRVARSRVMCDIEEFGDPAPNIVKRCEVSYNWRKDERYRGWRLPGASGADRWRQCADEGELCRLPGAAKVRYGANGRYAYRDANNVIACSNAVFGDPLPDVAKQCDFRADDDDTPGPLAWDSCAAENARCSVRGAAMVRYGRSGHYFYREVSDGVDCSNRAFGGDPAPQQVKRCETLRLRR